jgi:hypothetical protein
MKRDFASEAAALETQLTTQRDVAVARLRVLYEAWARSLLGIEQDGDLVAQVRAAVERGIEAGPAADAIERLHASEQRQWEIGSWASGAGDGLSSMFEVRSLQLAQAWLWSTQASADAMGKARALLEQVREDPNRIAERHANHMHALDVRLKSAPTD